MGKKLRVEASGVSGTISLSLMPWPSRKLKSRSAAETSKGLVVTCLAELIREEVGVQFFGRTCKMLSPSRPFCVRRIVSLSQRHNKIVTSNLTFERFWRRLSPQNQIRTNDRCLFHRFAGLDLNPITENCSPDSRAAIDDNIIPQHRLRYVCSRCYP